MRSCLFSPSCEPTIFHFHRTIASAFPNLALTGFVYFCPKALVSHRNVAVGCISGDVLSLQVRYAYSLFRDAATRLGRACRLTMRAMLGAIPFRISVLP